MKKSKCALCRQVISLSICRDCYTFYSVVINTYCLFGLKRKRRLYAAEFPHLVAIYGEQAAANIYICLYGDK